MRLIDADAMKETNERLLHCDFPYVSEETLEELIDDAPTIDLLDQTVYGYSIRFLAHVAAVMAKKGITEEQAADIVKDIRASVSFFYEEQQEILKKALDDMFPGATGKAQKNYTDWELRSE